MNNYDEIKRLVENSRRALSQKIDETHTKEIRTKYGMLNEQITEKNSVVELDVDTDEKTPFDDKKDSEDIGTKSEKQKGYKIQGNIIILHGKSEADLQLTTDEKNAFIESVDEFRNDVAELVEFGKMNVYEENVEWSGKVLELNLEFFYKINEPHGIYVNGEMVKLDQEYLELVGKLQSNYEKFKAKWGKIVASRQPE